MQKRLLIPALMLLAGTILHAQKQEPVAEVSLAYSSPQTFATDSKSTVFQGQFQCGDDGSIFFQGFETYSDDSGMFTLQSLSPAGRVIGFQAATAPGYGAYSSPFSTFVTNSRVYTLVTADKVDPMETSRKLGFSRFVLEYDYKGSFIKSIPIEAGPTVLAIAAFNSGDILLVAQEKYSKRVSLSLIDDSGSKRSDLNLFDKDYLGLIKGRDGASVPDAANYLKMMLADAQYVPYGENLLVVPINTMLPILELNEGGILRSVSLDLPKGGVIGSMLPTNGRDWMVMVGKTKNDVDTYSSDKSSATITTPEIQEFDPTDGQLIRKIEISKGLYTLCQRDGELLFLTTRVEDGRLQVVKGTFSR